MSDTLTLLEFAHALKTEVEPLYPTIHPCGATTIHHYMSDLFRAADAGDGHEVARLSSLIRSKVEIERLLCCG